MCPFRPNDQQQIKSERREGGASNSGKREVSNRKTEEEQRVETKGEELILVPINRHVEEVACVQIAAGERQLGFLGGFFYR